MKRKIWVDYNRGFTWSELCDKYEISRYRLGKILNDSR
jgi:DNA-binding transcriptional regulator LsrR (DeoR family)